MSPHRSSLLTALAIVGLTAPAFAETTLGDIEGTWATPILETPTPGGGPSAFVRQKTSFVDGRQTLTVEAFADAGGTQPLFTYDSSGPFVDRGPWEAVEGSRALDLTNERSEVTAHVDAPDLWAAISMANCDLIVGEAVDIADCVDGPPFSVTDCVDMDIVLVDQGGSRLRYGGGDFDRCTTRPTEPSETEFFGVE